jgi:hypothetical protein
MSDKLQPIPQDKIQEGHPWRDWLFHLREKVNSSALVGSGVTSIVAGTNVTIAPVTGLGDVTVNATLSVGPMGPPGPTGPAGVIGIDGIDGNDGDRGFQGPIGNTGNTGSVGPQGPIGFALDGVDGDEGMPIPGSPGATGQTGSAGQSGSPGFSIDGIDGEEGMPIPGNIGATGATGAQGVPGVAVFALDGEEGPEGFHIPGNQGIQGSTGAQGVPGVAVFALDGEEGPEGFHIPGNQGIQGSTGAQGVPGVAVYLEAPEAEEPINFQGVQGNVGTQAPPLGFSGGLTGSTTINDTVTPTTGGVTLASQIANVGSSWRVCSYGSFVAVSSITARNATVTPYWGTTALPAIAVVVLVSVAQTTNWMCEFELTGSSTTAIWTTGFLGNKLDYPAIVAGTSSANKLDLATAGTTSVTAGAQTLDLRFSMSSAVATDQWVVNSVTMECLK